MFCILKLVSFLFKLALNREMLKTRFAKLEWTFICVQGSKTLNRVSDVKKMLINIVSHRMN